MHYETIACENPGDGIAILKLNRPAKYNAVNLQMQRELEHFWNERMYDLDTHVIILMGAGDKGFCAGLDMKESVEDTKDLSVAEFYAFQARLARLNLLMRRVPQPIIACVHGVAAGQGFSFSLASDIRIISEDARLCAAYINIGLGGADMSCSYFLPRLIGAGRAYEFMLTGNFMSAAEAMQLGLVSRVVPREKLLETAIELARTMNSKSPLALRLTKEAINMNLHAGGLEHALQMEDRNQTLMCAKNILDGAGGMVSPIG